MSTNSRTMRTLIGLVVVLVLIIVGLLAALAIKSGDASSTSPATRPPLNVQPEDPEDPEPGETQTTQPVEDDAGPVPGIPGLGQPQQFPAPRTPETVAEGLVLRDWATRLGINAPWDHPRVPEATIWDFGGLALNDLFTINFATKDRDDWVEEVLELFGWNTLYSAMDPEFVEPATWAPTQAQWAAWAEADIRTSANIQPGYPVDYREDYEDLLVGSEQWDPADVKVVADRMATTYHYLSTPSGYVQATKGGDLETALEVRFEKTYAMSCMVYCRLDMFDPRQVWSDLDDWAQNV